MTLRTVSGLAFGCIIFFALVAVASTNAKRQSTDHAESGISYGLDEYAYTGMDFLYNGSQASIISGGVECNPTSGSDYASSYGVYPDPPAATVFVHVECNYFSLQMWSTTLAQGGGFSSCQVGEQDEEETRVPSCWGDDLTVYPQ